MKLKIRHFNGDASTDEHWNTALEEAKDVLCRWVREGTVDRVEIRDAKDRLIFHYPQETRSA